MAQETRAQHPIKRFETLKGVKHSRVGLIGRLSERIASTAEPLYRLRATNAQESVQLSVERCAQEMSELEPQVKEIQVNIAQTYLRDDRLWQRNLNRISRDQRDRWGAEYQAFKEQASQDPNVQAGLKILEERKKKEDEARSKINLPPKPPTPSEPQTPLQAPEEQEPVAAVKVTKEDTKLDLTKLGLGKKQLEVAEAIPQDPDLVIPRLELCRAFYPDRSSNTSRIDNNLTVIQNKLPEEFTVVNYGSTGRGGSLYGIRRRKDYAGLLDESHTVPRILQSQETNADKGKQSGSLPVASVEATKPIDSSEEDPKEVAARLMAQINQSLEKGASLDPVIMQALQEAYDEAMGKIVVKVETPVLPVTKAPAGKRSRPGLEEYLPDLPTADVSSSKTETAQVVPFEQREENKIKPEERYFLGFVFGLLAEARARNEQYINNDDFKARLKPRRIIAEEGKTLVESYSTNDIIRLFGSALEKLIKESQQPLIQWDDETRELFHSVTTYAAEKGKNVESIRWPLRIQLIAISRALDMGSRRISERV